MREKGYWIDSLWARKEGARELGKLKKGSKKGSRGDGVKGEYKVEEGEEEEEGQGALGRGTRPLFPELCAEKEVEGKHPVDWHCTRAQLTGIGVWPWPKHNQEGPNGLCLPQGERHSSAPSLLLLAPFVGLCPTAILPFGLLQMVMMCLSQVSSANRASEGACLWKLAKSS